MSNLIVLAVIGFSFTALIIAIAGRARWRQRARMAEKQNEANRKAHDVQNRVITDRNFRQRVRRYFDRS